MPEPGPLTPTGPPITYPGGIPVGGSGTVGGSVYSSYASYMAACEAKLWACRKSADPTNRDSHRGLAKCLGEVINCRFNCS